MFQAHDFIQRQITRKWYKIELYLQWQINSKSYGLLMGAIFSRAYSKRAVQPICAVQDAICAVQNEKLCSPK